MSKGLYLKSCWRFKRVVNNIDRVSAFLFDQVELEARQGDSIVQVDSDLHNQIGGYWGHKECQICKQPVASACFFSVSIHIKEEEEDTFLLK